MFVAIVYTVHFASNIYSSSLWGGMMNVHRMLDSVSERALSGPLSTENVEAHAPSDWLVYQPVVAVLLPLPFAEIPSMCFRSP